MMDYEKAEALQEMCMHYGMPVLLALVDEIVGNISKGVMSVPLDKDPEKAALQLYAERMKSEGAVAVKNALFGRVQSLKQTVREKKHAD